MFLAPYTLLPGEQIIASKNANFVVSSSAYNLDRFPHDFLLKRIGLEGKEALGGRLYVTNLRLIFRAHRANRVHGQLSIFLSEITQLEDASTLLVKRLVVTTSATLETFIVWGVSTLMQTIQAAQQTLRPEHVQAVWEGLLADPTALGDAMQFSPLMDRLVKRSADLGGDLAEILSDPLSAATAVHLAQLYEGLARDD